MSEPDAAREELVASALRRLHLNLQVVHAGVIVAAAALHHQNAEHDEEIARMLQYCVGDRLADQIERAAELISSVARLPLHPDQVATWDPRHPLR